MKRLRHILALLLLLSVVYAGVGVSIVHYCCAGCAAGHACCTSGCARCSNSHHGPEESCKDDGCTATFYKVDLVKCPAENPVVTVPVIQLLCEVWQDFLCLLPADEAKEAAYAVPPHPDSSRHYLALYSVLII